MRHGNIKVDQIDSEGNLFIDYDQIFTPKELKFVVESYFNVVAYINDSPVVEYKGLKFALYLKNITYLGYPHPKFKKRVQLGSNFKPRYYNLKKQGIELIILGIYHYNDSLVFVDFDTKEYAGNKSNNSSAHVFGSDLQQAIMNGYYSKIDANENKISAFTSEYIHEFLDVKFFNIDDKTSSVAQIFDLFFHTMHKTWKGIDCYNEMFFSDYCKKRESEWPGFYFEYRLEEFLDKHPDLKTFVQYKQNKSKDGIDLDLYFPFINSYGDLKCHSTNSTAILGNKYSTIHKVIQKSSIFYIVLEHDTVKDSAMNFITTHHWNQLLNKENLMSYSKRMKGIVYLKSYLILEINKYNARYLSEFQKGFKNSNGIARDEKISIKKKDINNFVIYKKRLESE